MDVLLATNINNEENDMPTISKKLQDKTYKILDQFIKNTAYITVNNDLERDVLLRRTDELFNALKALGKKEFAKIFIEYNFTSNDVNENEKYQSILNYLLAAVIEKYSLTDLLRYFFLEHISQKENRPDYSNSTSIISYCYQLFSYWLRQLRNKPSYELKTEHAGIADSIQYVKISSNKDYVDNDLNDVFKQHLAILREQAFPLQNVISRVNSSNDQAYHQQLLDKEKESGRNVRMLKRKEQELQKAAARLTTREKKFESREQLVAQNEYKNEEVSKLYREERAAVKKELETVRQHQELMAKERQAFKTESEMLQEKISVLEGQLDEKNEIIKTFIEKEQKFEERLSLLNATVEEKSQEGNAVLIQQQDKLLEKEQSFEEKLNSLTTSEENFLERSELLIQDKQESDPSLQASSSAFFKPAAANNPDLQNKTITLDK